MNRAILTLAAVLCAAVVAGQVSALAQGPDVDFLGLGPGGGQARGCLQQAMTAAGVSDNQKADLKAIRDRYAPQIKEVMQSGLAPEEKRAKVRELVTAARAEAQRVLTEQQIAAIRAYVRENCRPQRPGPWGGPGAPMMGCLQDALKAVGISVEQTEKIKTIRDRLEADLKALRADTSLAPEQKRAKAGELTRAAWQAAQDVLTAEQKDAVRKWMQENCKGRAPGAGPGPGQGPRGPRGLRPGAPPAR